MATTKDRALSRQLGTLFNLGAIRELTDGQLLERFARGDGEPAELAFAALVERHGAMVARVCRSQLADPHDADDAFQATFLVLVEKARGLWVRDSLGPWLHQVALRTASCARSAAIRRGRIERLAAERAGNRGADDDSDAPERARILHEEIDRLPDRYRVPIVLCDLEGRTCEEAARVMGRPVGTIKCWRARGRERLRRRLIGAGVAPTAAVGAALAPGLARAAVPRAVEEQTVRAAARILSERMIAGVVPASVSLLVKGVIRSMFMSKLRMAAAIACAMTLVGSGMIAAARVAAEDGRSTSDGPPAETSPPDTRVVPPTGAVAREMGGETWNLPLRDAVRIALDRNNTELVRVIASGASPSGVAREGPGPAPIVIARLDADAHPSRFKAEIMAMVRSVEQQYWNLSVAHVQVWAAERAVGLARGILGHEQAELKAGRGTLSDVAEARQRLEQFRLDLVTRTSDVITTERLLRNLLGLPPADDRRIIPVTPPTEARLEPDWDRSLAAMLAEQPDIQMARDLVRQAESAAPSRVLDLAAEAFSPRPADEGKRAPSHAPAGGRPSPLVRRQRDFLQQVVHQTTHSLARCFLEIDANYKQFQTASRVRQAAAQRLDAMRHDREAGRIPLDRFLDAVSQYATAVSNEARYRATYNIAIVALEEAKGTLLEYDRIAIAEAPEGLAPPAGGGRRARHEPTIPDPIGPAAVPPDPHPPGPRPADAASPAKGAGSEVHAAGKTYSFHLTIGSGPRPFEIRGSLTVAPSGK